MSGQGGRSLATGAPILGESDLARSGQYIQCDHDHHNADDAHQQLVGHSGHLADAHSDSVRTWHTVELVGLGLQLGLFSKWLRRVEWNSDCNQTVSDFGRAEHLLYRLDEQPNIQAMLGMICLENWKRPTKCALPHQSKCK